MEIEKLFNKKTIFGKYQIQKSIGSGTFSSVFSGINIIDHSEVAIKIEKNFKGIKLLENEVYFLHILKGFGIPEIKSFGHFGNYNILIEPLLGKSLLDIAINQKLTIKDVCMIAIQLIDRIQFIHSKFIIHRDIKPENCLLDPENQKFIFCIDFGLSRKYRSSRTGKHIKFSIPKKIYGSLRYCSINATKGVEQSRRDDMESIGYMLIYLIKLILPWQKINLKNNIVNCFNMIYNLKKNIPIGVLCKKLPIQFDEYIQYTRKLHFEEEPNYDYSRNLFLNVLNEMNDSNDLKFSWFLLKNNKFLRWIKRNNSQKFSDNKKNFINLFKIKSNPCMRILKKLKNSHEKERNIHSHDIIRKNSELKIEKKSNERILNNLKKIKINTKGNFLSIDEIELKENNTIPNNKVEESFTNITFFNENIDIESEKEIENISSDDRNESPQNKNYNLKINIDTVFNKFNSNDKNIPKNKNLNNTDNNLQNIKHNIISPFPKSRNEKYRYNLINLSEKKSFELKIEKNKNNMSNNASFKSADHNLRNFEKSIDNSRNNIYENGINYAGKTLQTSDEGICRIIEGKQQHFNINYKNYRQGKYEFSSIYNNNLEEKNKNNKSKLFSNMNNISIKTSISKSSIDNKYQNFKKESNKEHLKVIKVSNILNKEKNLNKNISLNRVNNVSFEKIGNLLDENYKKLSIIKKDFRQKNQKSNEINKISKPIILKSINYFNIENNQFNENKSNFYGNQFYNSLYKQNIANSLNSKKQLTNISNDFNNYSWIHKNIEKSKVHKAIYISKLKHNSSFGENNSKINFEKIVNKVYRSCIKRNLSK